MNSKKLESRLKRRKKNENSQRILEEIQKGSYFV